MLKILVGEDKYIVIHDVEERCSATMEQDDKINTEIYFNRL